uniref:Uncharacterized protein n=1 Tax=Rhizophora mucronata TaxID=61149 RepID=A0A2P2PK31_RHIMU
MPPSLGLPDQNNAPSPTDQTAFKNRFNPNGTGPETKPPFSTLSNPKSTTAASSRPRVLANAADRATLLTSRKTSTSSSLFSSMSLSAKDLITSYFRELTGMSLTSDKS